MRKEVFILLLLVPFVAAQYMYNPNIGQMQCNEGATQCDGNAFQVCVNANWQTTEQCEFGCSSQGCAQAPANQPSGNEQPPAEYVRPQVCVGGEKRCDGQKFQLCVNNEWQTQQTCGKTQECTSKGCKSLPKEPIPVVAPPKFVPPVVEPTPAPHVESVEVEPLEIDERETTSKPSEGYLPVVEKPKPKGIISFFKSLFGFSKELTCSEECEESYVDCVKDANKWFSITDRMEAKFRCQKYYESCLDDCEEKELEPGKVSELPPTEVAEKPMPKVEEMPVIEPEKPKPKGIIDFFKSLFGFGKKLTCPEECEKSYDDCVKEANKWFSISDRMKAKYWCYEANTACLDDCEKKELELRRLKELPIATPEKVEEAKVVPKGVKSKEKLPAGISEPIVVPPPGDESKLIPTCRGLCAKSYDDCVKEANKLFSVVDSMKAKYWCYEANTACLDDCKKEEMKIPPEAMPSS